MREWWVRATSGTGRGLGAANRAAGGLWVDVALYGVSALFAWATIHSTLAPHRAWAAIAVTGYAVAAVLATGQLVLRLCAEAMFSDPELPPGEAARGHGRGRGRGYALGRVDDLGGTGTAGARAGLTILTWWATALLPLVVEAVQRAQGRLDRAQDEVMVIEDGGRRLIETGTPYLDRAAIAALPEADRLLAYLPYQPGMSVFGLPHALAGPGPAPWWTDARLGFALVTMVAIGAALMILRRAGMPTAALVRALQAATVLPICALTLASGGDDLPVLSLCLLALALAATGRLTGSGLAVGAAAALKLFAWPVAVVLGVHALTQRRLGWYSVGAVGLPVLTAVPALLQNPHAVAENVLAFPFGKGLVTSPAASPLPGHLLATGVPGGRVLALALLAVVAGVLLVILIRRPPRTAADASLLAGYGLLAAMLLLPATRFGYLLYPAVFLVWVPALRPGGIPAPRATPVEALAAPGGY